MISDKLKTMQPYDADHEAYAICLNANESFVPIAPHVKEEMLKQVAQVSLNRYPDPYATEVCAGFARLYNVSPQWVTVGNGSDEIIGLLISCLLDKGSKVMTFEQDFSMYGFYSYLNECQQVIVAKDDDLRVNVQRVIDQAQAQQVQMIIFSNPCNPTSIGMTREDVQRIIEESNALVVVDEAYMEFYDQSVLDWVERYPNLIVLKTCSKALAMAALRLGFAVTNPEITTILKTGKSPYNVNALSQAMGAVIFDYPEMLSSALGELMASKRMLYNGMVYLNEWYSGIKRVMPSDTNFVFIEVDDSQKIFEQLKERGILVRKSGDYLRVTAGTLFENDSVLEALKQILTEGESNENR